MTPQLRCDTLGLLRSVVFEASSAHGGRVLLRRVHRRDDGQWVLSEVDYDHYAPNDLPARAGDPWASGGTVSLSRGVIPRDVTNGALGRMREALVVVPRAAPLVSSATEPAGRVLTTSRDFHVALRLTDDTGASVEHFFSGYESDDAAQAERVALELAADEFRALADSVVVRDALSATVASDPEIRTLFDTHFFSAAQRGPDFGKWYLRQRVLGMTRWLGHDAQVPTLLGLLDPALQPNGAQVPAINALVSVTGYEARYDADGRPRLVADAAADLWRACSTTGR